MKMNQILFFLSLILLLLSGCTFYGKVGNFEECKDYYALSQKSYKTEYTEDEIINSWEKEEHKILKDTFYKNEYSYAPQVKVFNYRHSEIDVKINYIFFQIIKHRKTEITIHGICLNEELKTDLSIEELKKINEIIRKDFIDKFRKK